MKFIGIVVIALAITACAAPPPAATPTPTPQPTPTPIIIQVPVPGPTVFKTPQVCLDALEANDRMWYLEDEFLDYVIDDIEMSKADMAEFSELIDKFEIARDKCIGTTDPSA